jgi:hypothetical protein
MLYNPFYIKVPYHYKEAFSVDRGANPFERFSKTKKLRLNNDRKKDFSKLKKKRKAAKKSRKRKR